MEIEREGNSIYINDKELSNLDKLVLDFISLINFNYVIVSGYVAILFGRSRTTEDIDMFVEPTEQEFYKFCDSLKSKDFSLFNAESPEDAYDLLKEGLSLRIIYQGEVFPNFELKLPKDNLSRISMSEKMRLVVNNKLIYISPLEIQIAYKLYLGSDKDIEDARHMYEVLKDKLNLDKFKYFIRAMKIKDDAIRKTLGEDFGV